jgi:hypothetical protein
VDLDLDLYQNVTDPQNWSENYSRSNHIGIGTADSGARPDPTEKREKKINLLSYLSL